MSSQSVIAAPSLPMSHVLAMRFCRTTLLLALACLACWIPGEAGSQGVLVLDDTATSNPTETAAARLSLTVTSTRNIASFVLQADSGTRWDAMVLDLTRLALTPVAEAAIADHLSSGGSLIVATELLGTLGGLQAVLGVECRANTSGTAVYDAAEPGSPSVFEAGDSIPSPMRLINSSRADCSPDSAEVLARFGPTADSAAAIYRLASGPTVLGVSLSRIDDLLDANANGIADVVELMTNVLELNLASQRAGIAAVIDGDVFGAQQWAAELGVPVTFYETLDEFLRADTTLITGVLISSASLETERLSDLNAYAERGVPVLVFSDAWETAPAWQESWGFTLRGELGVGPLMNAGGGIGAQLLDAAPLAEGLTTAPSDTLVFSPPWYAIAARDGLPVIALDIDNHRVVSTFPLAAADPATQTELLLAAFRFADRAARTVSIVSNTPEVWAEVAAETGRFPVIISPSSAALREAVLDGPVDAIVFELNAADVPESGFEAELLERSQEGEFGLIVQQQGPQTAWPEAFGVTLGEVLPRNIQVVRSNAQLTGVFKLPQSTPSTLLLGGDISPIDDAAGRIVISRVHDAVALVGDRSGRAFFGVTPLFTLADIDSDRDQQADDSEYAGGMLNAVLHPQRALVAGDGPERLLQAAVEATGLVVDAVSLDAAEFASDAYSYALWQATGDGVLTPELTASVLARVAAAQPTLLFVTDADAAPEFSAALGLIVEDPLTAGPLVEPFESPLGIFRSPRFVPSPLSVTAPVAGDPGDQFRGEDSSRSLAVYNVNVGPAASVLSEDSSWLINGWDPSLRGNADFDSDGVPDVSELIANELLVVSRLPVGRVTGPQTVLEGTRVLVNASTSFDRNDSELTYEWDLDQDGQFDDDIGPVVLFDASTVDGPSSAEARLRVTNELGIQAFSGLSFQVLNAPPRIVNAGTLRVEEGSLAILSVDVLDVPADVVSVQWVFDDGFEASGATIAREFDQLGVYEAVVRAVDDDGGEDSSVVRVEYINAAPTITLEELPAEVEEGSVLELRASAQDNTGPPTVRWRFGDGQEAEGQVVEHAYRDEGTYTILATATDSLGAVSSASLELSVVNAAPTIVSDAPTTVDGFNEYRYVVVVDDPGDDVIRYDLTLSPDGMRVSDSGVITWTPSLGALADAVVVLTVSDGDGGDTQQSWTISVAAEDTDRGGAPDVCELRFGTNINDPEDDASDEDGDGLTLSEECAQGSDPSVFSGPGVPIPVSPNNDVAEFRFGTVLTFENTTDPEGDALSYQVELSLDEFMQQVTFTRSNIAATGRVQTRVDVPGTLDEDRRYYWRVRAVTADVVGEWSAVISFRVNRTNRPPGRATLVTPLAFSDSRRPTLIWRNASDPDGDLFTYELELYDSSLDGTRVWALDNITPLQTETSATLTFALEDEGGYVWRVRAVDSSPPFPVGQWSALGAFTVDTANLGPPRPELLSPGVGQLVDLSMNVVLQWTQGRDPNGDQVEMTVELARDENFESVLLSDVLVVEEPDEQELDITEFLSLDTTYWWRVEATDSRAPSGLSTSTFTVLPANRSPTDTVSESPEPGATIVNDGNGVPLTVRNATDPDPFDVLVYEFQVAESVTMGATVARPFDVGAGPDGLTTYVVNELAAGQYFWRARAFDGARQGQWSDVRAFFLTAPIDLDAGIDAELEVDGPDAGGDQSDRVGGGGCAIGAAGSTAALMWWCAVLGCTSLRSRRRRPMHAPPKTARRSKCDHDRN
ncbi:MAG: PKD repeat protein [Bradymonadia bacterium]